MTSPKNNSKILQTIVILLSSGVIASIVAFLMPKIWPENRPPHAVIVSSDTLGSEPLEVLFDAAKSSDPEGLPLVYNWYIDGSEVSSIETIKHTFDTPGKYTVKLLVTDSKGLGAKDSLIVEVTSANPITTNSNPPRKPEYRINWSKKDEEGRLYSETFSHLSQNMHNSGAVNVDGTYSISNKEGKIYKVTFTHEGQFCGWNYNPDGGYSGKTQILNDTTFKWFRRWDGKPCKEIYEAFYEVPNKIPVKK